jgi:CheY-like chemotaxis protein
MPLKDGRQVLSELRANREFDDTPVIVLTTSGAKSDERFVSCFRNTYFFTKPIGHLHYVDLVKSIALNHLQFAR